MLVEFSWHTTQMQEDLNSFPLGELEKDLLLLLLFLCGMHH